MSNQEAPYSTTNGCPVYSPYASNQIGKPGPLVFDNHHLFDLLGHFDRERIPERVVHAKGAGAHGYFEVTDDVSDIATAKFLLGVGKKTPLFARFSTVGGESGSADSLRDPRGFSIKLYTEEGNIDWVYNNTPIFFIRNPSKFPLFIHTQKRNPQTHLKDPTVFWDYFVQNQEAVHQVMILFSDRGTPNGVRHMHAYSGHAYKWIKPDGSFNYVQVHLKTDQGIKNFTQDESVKVAGENPDHSISDLFDSIESGNYPSWTCYVQVMSPEEAEKQDFSIFDLTKVWPQDKFPLRRFGKFTLNKNPENYFAEVEQAAFSPSNTVPGWEPSADPVLQSRLFSYPDTHRHRLGPNFFQIPVNRCPYANNPFIRDGLMNVTGNYGSEPNYPSSLKPLVYSQSKLITPSSQKDSELWRGHAEAFHWDMTGPDDYKQAAKLWEVFGKTNQQDSFISNVAGHLTNANPKVQKGVFEMFGRVNPEIADRLEKAVADQSKL